MRLVTLLEDLLDDSVGLTSPSWSDVAGVSVSAFVDVGALMAGDAFVVGVPNDSAGEAATRAEDLVALAMLRMFKVKVKVKEYYSREQRNFQ